MVQFFGQVLDNQQAVSEKVQKAVQKRCSNGSASFEGTGRFDHRSFAIGLLWRAGEIHETHERTASLASFWVMFGDNWSDSLLLDDDWPRKRWAEKNFDFLIASDSP